MTIESATHYLGARELVQRHRALIDYSRSTMRPDDFAAFEQRMLHAINDLNAAMDDWLHAENLKIMSSTCFTWSLTEAGLQPILPPERYSDFRELTREQPDLLRDRTAALGLLGMCRPAPVFAAA